MPYDIEEHKHRFAAWAASRAAHRGVAGFKVEMGKLILENIGFNRQRYHPDMLPRPGELDAFHLYWRECSLWIADQIGFTISHGVAAKLINVYLKSRFVVSAVHNHPNVTDLHPPIDSILLSGLRPKLNSAQKEALDAACPHGWSNLCSKGYQSVIDIVREHLNHQPMWMIEQYWQGHQ